MMGRSQLSSWNQWLAVGVVAVILLLAFIHPAAGSSEDLLDDVPVVRIEQELMGTRWVFEVADSPGEPAVLNAISQGFREVARIDQMMSEWRPTSPLSAINRNAGVSPVTVPEELIAILRRSIEYGELTDGAFDITWRGMGELWSFDEDFAVPEDSAIQAAVRRVNFREIRLTGDQVLLPHRGMAIGLGGIAKGYAVDRAAQVLHRNGLENFLIDAGGDIYVSGRKGDRPWKLGIRHPRGTSKDLLAVVSVRDASLVTSGDYERYRIVDGVRYHHLINPQTGRPARGTQSVSVIAPTAEEADVLATAIFVLGPSRGMALAARRDQVEVLIVDEYGQVRMTDGMAEKTELR